MKYNTTYTPKTSFKETLINVEKIRNILKAFYKNRFNLIEVNPPLQGLETSDLILDLTTETRHITFDFGGEYRVGKMYLSHTNWIHELIYKANLKENEGLLADSTYVWRDIEENSSVSAERNEISIQVVLDQKTDIKEFVELEVFNLFDEILKLAIELNPEIHHQFNEVPEIITAQNLSNMMMDLKPLERESKLILDKNAFILKNPGKKMLSGQRHSYIPPTLYDLNNHYHLFLKDTVNSWPMRVASISQISTGQDLADQLRVYKESKFLELDFYSRVIKSETKIIEVKINIPRLAMVLLQKGHIAEVQAGTTNQEVSHVKERYKIETL